MAVTGHVYEYKSYLGRDYWVVQGPFSICGYIQTSPSECRTGFGIDWERIPVDVHGGITFVGYLYRGEVQGYPKGTIRCSIEKRHADDEFVIGFDTAHAGDMYHLADDQDGFGLYSNFFNNDDHLWTVEEVREECKNAIEQLDKENEKHD